MEEQVKQVKVIKIKGDEFVFDIKKVSVADFLAIEVEKQRLSAAKYFDIATTYFKSTSTAANIIDMIAVFRVMAPSIEKSIGTKSYESMNIIDIKELLSIYLKEIAPWFRSWMDEFSSPFEDEEDAKE